MELAELTAYADRKYHIEEQHLWASFPGFSVLKDPQTGKWAALLMRQHDYDSGRQIERCDIRCGQQPVHSTESPYLSDPFRMHGSDWTGVRFNSSTDPRVVYDLLDRALSSHTGDTGTIVLDSRSSGGRSAFHDTPLPFAGHRTQDGDAHDPLWKQNIPDRIRDMMKLYRPWTGRPGQRYESFYRQGKFMEDYSDDAPYDFEFRQYFTTYHDLSVPMLRGYFAWRSAVRNGEYNQIAPSLAYMYIYELLNGIGTRSPSDALEKMRQFETGFIDPGFGSPRMWTNLRGWMADYSILHNLPPDTALQFMKPKTIDTDRSLLILRDPDEQRDEDVLSALLTFAEKARAQSPVLDSPKGVRLFAESWREALRESVRDGRDLFTSIFRKPRRHFWEPLSNAILWDPGPHKDVRYELNPVRTYTRENDRWYEESYNSAYFDLHKLREFTHAADRILRRYMHTGRNLRAKESEAWAEPYVQSVAERDRSAEIEAARPKVTIDLSALNQIRADADTTKDKLLTEEEKAELLRPDEDTMPSSGHTEPSGDISLDSAHREILLDVLNGKSAAGLIRKAHLMPAVVTDTINEAFFDEIGDNVLECDGDTITVVDDYRDDVVNLMRGMVYV